MRRLVPFVGVAVLAFALGWVAARGQESDRTSRLPHHNRTCVIEMPSGRGGGVIRLTVRRVTPPGDAPVEYDPKPREQLVGPDDWCITVGGSTYICEPARD